MRLDVDNMSYEEVLELEEQIGDVSTGLKEEYIMKFLKQNKKEIPTGTESVKELEPCCICQEQCVEGEGIGELDCGHDFHVDCIKQWLMQNNLCPICKLQAWSLDHSLPPKNKRPPGKEGRHKLFFIPEIFC